MSFVPVVVQPPIPSPRVTELGQQLLETIARFRREHPDLTSDEINQALNLAVEQGRVGIVMVAILLVGISLVFGTALLYLI